MAPSYVTVKYIKNGASTSSPKDAAIVLDDRLAAVRVADIPGWDAWTSPKVVTDDAVQANVDTTVVLTANPKIVFLRLATQLTGVTTAENKFSNAGNRKQGFDVLEDLLAKKATLRHQTSTTGTTSTSGATSTQKATGGIFCFLFGIC